MQSTQLHMVNDCATSHKANIRWVREEEAEGGARVMDGRRRKTGRTRRRGCVWGGGGVKLNKGRHKGHKRVMREWMSERREELGGGSLFVSALSVYHPVLPHPSVVCSFWGDLQLLSLPLVHTQILHNLFNSLILVAIFCTKVYLNRLKKTQTVEQSIRDSSYHEAQWAKSSVFKFSCSVYYLCSSVTVWARLTCVRRLKHTSVTSLCEAHCHVVKTHSSLTDSEISMHQTSRSFSSPSPQKNHLWKQKYYKQPSSIKCG